MRGDGMLKKANKVRDLFLALNLAARFDPRGRL